MSTVALSKRWPVRATRAFLALCLAYNLAWGIFDLSRGRASGWISLACVVAITVTLTWQVRYLRRADLARLARLRRPDYSAIARMEREVYDRTFEHEGAPQRRIPPPPPVPSGAILPREDAGAFETLATLKRERKRSARCYCNYCRGRAGVHGDEAKALYRAEVEAVMAQYGPTSTAATTQTTETDGDPS